MMGQPVTASTRSAAPPRVSPSVFVKIMPSTATASLKALATFTASWPAMASTTSSTSSTVTAALIRSSSAISSWSTCRRPAVSRITMSLPWSLAWATAFFAISSGFSVPMANTGTPACLPTTCSWSMAAGRYTSQATNRGRFPCFKNHLPSFAAWVVLPLPCRPQSISTVGGLDLMWMRAASFPPIRAVSSSLTILTTCWAGVRLSITSCPMARSVTPAINSLATL